MAARGEKCRPDTGSGEQSPLLRIAVALPADRQEKNLMRTGQEMQAVLV
jgi:hypothetical protein